MPGLSTLPANRTPHVRRLLPPPAGPCRALPYHLAKPLPGFAGPCRDDPARQPTTHGRALPGVSWQYRALPQVLPAPRKGLGKLAGITA
jgi:hypothetical protein